MLYKTDSLVLTNKLHSIETIRGLAALAVCLFHFASSNIVFHGNSIFFKYFASQGWLGVEAFFVVSGFIIPYSLFKAGYTTKRFWQFLIKRLLRIEPPYLLSVVIVIILGYLSSLVPNFKGVDFKFSSVQALLHIAYLPEHFGYKWLSPVYWTLEAEFHFYLFIGLLFPIFWNSQLSLAIGLVISMALGFCIPLIVFKFMFLFSMGILACFYKLGKINKVYFCTSLVVCVLISLLQESPYIMSVIGILTVGIICFLQVRTQITDFLGRISFSLYLLHVPIGGRVINLLGRFADTQEKVWAVLLISLLITLSISFLFYKTVELPFLKLSKKINYTG